MEKTTQPLDNNRNPIGVLSPADSSDIYPGESYEVKISGIYRITPILSEGQTFAMLNFRQNGEFLAEMCFTNGMTEYLYLPAGHEIFILTNQEIKVLWICRMK